MAASCSCIQPFPSGLLAAVPQVCACLLTLVFPAHALPHHTLRAPMLCALQWWPFQPHQQAQCWKCSQLVQVWHLHWLHLPSFVHINAWGFDSSHVCILGHISKPKRFNVFKEHRWVAQNFWWLSPLPASLCYASSAFSRVQGRWPWHTIQRQCPLPVDSHVQGCQMERWLTAVAFKVICDSICFLFLLTSNS